MSTQWAAQVNFHTWKLARIKVPATQINDRPEPNALQAATNILTELGIDLGKTRARSRTKPAMYALVGYYARGPHDQCSSIRHVVSVLRDNVWRDGKRYTATEFTQGAVTHGWLHIETSEISSGSEPVRLARAKGFLPETATENRFEMMLFTRDQYH